MKISSFNLIFPFLLLLLFLHSAQSQCCLKTIANSKKCTACPQGTHLFRGNCLIDIDKCLKYSNGFQCSECDKGFVAQGETCSVVVAKEYEDTYVEEEKNDNALILADYTRAIHQQVAAASVLQAIQRKYPNGTELTIIHYETSDKKYFESVGEFSQASAFIFQLKDFKQLPAKPGKQTTPPTNGSNQNNGNNSNSNNNTSNQKPTQQNNGPEQNPFGISKINYKYLNFSERTSDEGFNASDQLIKSINGDVLGLKPIVLAAYAQLKGLSVEYFTYYQSTDKKSIYEARTVYQLYRKKVFILSLNKTYLK